MNVNEQLSEGRRLHDFNARNRNSGEIPVEKKENLTVIEAAWQVLL